MKNVTRRKMLQNLGLAAGGFLATPLMGYDEHDQKLHLPDVSKLRTSGPPNPVKAITLGAGNRGNVYGNFALKYPEILDIVGVAEPIVIRNDRYCLDHKIPRHMSFETWEDVFKQPKMAEAIIITTPDDLHYGPAMQALKMGYHLLLEKPISPTEQECKDILEAAQESGKIVAVCHVLRYAPYFIELRDYIQSGKLGELVSISHFEPIEHVHMAHSFVRGNWHNSKETTPIILAKSCHDMDILRWLVGKPCEKVSAFGGLKWFHEGNKPEGATPRCMDGCAVEKDCPYSAMKIYYRDRQRTYVFDLPADKTQHGEAILDYLRTTDYGRCVYQMENDQPDHYVASMEFQDGVTAAFSMEAFTSYHGRRTRVMGSHGDIVGDMRQFVYTDFLSGEKTEWAMTTDGHGGGDWNLVKDWIYAIRKDDVSLLSSSIEASVESHVMAFKAETSRKEGIVAELRD